MKFILAYIMLFCGISCYSQTLELTLSVIQPRLGQYFYVSFKSDTLAKQVFNLPDNKFKIYSYSDFTNQSTRLSVNLTALKIGQNEIGPLTFNFNGKVYKTNILKFTVADSLPYVDKGVWIRKVYVDDSTTMVLIDQRIPTHNKVIIGDNNSINTSSEVNNNEKEVVLKIEDIENAKIEEWGSSSETKPRFGNELSFASYYKCFKVTVLNRKKPLVLTKKAFENLPDDYDFTNLKIN